jgi:hypothetical protein
MRTDTRLGTFDDVVAGVATEVEEIARRLRALIEAIHPDAVEVPRPGERTSGYGVGPRKMSETYAYIAPQTTYVNLGFYHGVSLPDPAGLLEGTGKELRHVKIRSIEEADQPPVRHLIREALRERRTALASANSLTG